MMTRSTAQVCSMEPALKYIWVANKYWIGSNLLSGSYMHLSDDPVKSKVPQSWCLWHLSCGYTGRGPNLFLGHFLGRGLVYSGRFFWDTYFWDEVRGACLLWALFWDEGRRLVYSGRRQEAPPGTELGAVVSRLSSHPARPAAASASLRPTSTQPSPLGLNSTLYQVRFEAGLQICDAHPPTHY